MIKDILNALNWRKNIRGRMFWSAFISFFLATLVTFLTDRLLLLLVGKNGNFLFLIFVFIVIFFLFTRPIVRYIRTIADGLMTIAQGNLDHRVPITNHDELGNVAQNINYMAEQLQSMMNRERQVETSKMELITNVSHDLRTPLTSMIGYLNLLKNDNYENLEEHKRFIHNAYNKSQQLKKLIDDLFEYTRLTSGAVHISAKPTELCGLLEQIITEFEPIAEEHGLKVKEIRDQKPVIVRLDAEMFVRAIDNLLMNALKFSHKPGVITVRITEREHDVYLAVENWGDPIAAEQEQLLFERFYKAELSRNDRNMAPGAGLGLSIAKNIVELHGGTIGLEHRNGHFVFYILMSRMDEGTGNGESASK